MAARGGVGDQGTTLPGQQRQEQNTMTPALPERPVTRGVRSLEVRWIFPGRLSTHLGRIQSVLQDIRSKH